MLLVNIKLLSLKRVRQRRSVKNSMDLVEKKSWIVYERLIPAYSKTWIFFFLHMALSIFGHIVTLTSPRCAFLSRSM